MPGGRPLSNCWTIRYAAYRMAVKVFLHAMNFWHRRYAMVILFQTYLLPGIQIAYAHLERWVSKLRCDTMAAQVCLKACCGMQPCAYRLGLRRQHAHSGVVTLCHFG